MIRTIAIVSLSSGVLGEASVGFEVEIGRKRLEALGLSVRFMPNARKGCAYLHEHPEQRAQDLLDAFADSTIDMILCAIGGDDTYRLLPYPLELDELERALTDKVFLGFWTPRFRTRGLKHANQSPGQPNGNVTTSGSMGAQAWMDRPARIARRDGKRPRGLTPAGPFAISSSLTP